MKEEKKINKSDRLLKAIYGKGPVEKWMEPYISRMSDLSEEATDFDVAEQLLLLRYEKRERERARRRRAWRIGGASVAAVAIIMLMVSLLGRVQNGLTIGKGKEVIYAMASTGLGEIDTIALKDGSMVILNANSQLSYPTSFQGSERRVQLLSGEAYFSVAHDSKKPFIVEQGPSVVKVLGTKFNLNAYHKEELRATLVEGSIELQRGALSSLLKPGEEAIVRERSISLSDVNINQQIGWIKGIYSFESETLEHILNHLQQWHKFDIKYERDNLRKLSYTGQVNRNQSLDRTLDLLSRSGHVKIYYDRASETVIVTSGK